MYKAYQKKAEMISSMKLQTASVASVKKFLAFCRKAWYPFI